jgi:uncharacterized protein (DUF433 family)
MSTVFTERIPLVENKAGDILLEGSRVFLEHVVEAFQQGKHPEDIQQGFPSISLADIYAVIAYYLRHRNEVERYMARQQERAVQAMADAQPYAPTALIEKMNAILYLPL